RLGRRDDATDTLLQAHLVADTIDDPLRQAEALLALAKAEGEAGLTTAAGTFEATLRLAATLPLRRTSSSAVPSPERRLDAILGVLAEQEAKSGHLAAAVQAARAIRYQPEMRTRALRTIAEVQTQRGLFSDARAILNEALDAARASQMPRDRRSS